MNVIFTSKETKISGGLKGFIKEKLIPIESIEGPIIDAEVIIVKEKINHSVEIFIKTKINSYKSKESHAILKQAVRKVLRNLKKQIKKNKAKLKDKKRINRKKGLDSQELDSVYTGDSSQNGQKIEIVKNYSSKPLTVMEAVNLLIESKENALLFRNSSNDKTAVVYYKRKNSVALIEEEN
jgi:ribosomal subunit interface protein